MFDAPYCWCCGEKEHKNGYGCNNPKCKEYYKLKDTQNIEQLLQPDAVYKVQLRETENK